MPTRTCFTTGHGHVLAALDHVIELASPRIFHVCEAGLEKRDKNRKQKKKKRKEKKQKQSVELHFASSLQRRRM